MSRREVVREAVLVIGALAAVGLLVLLLANVFVHPDGETVRVRAVSTSDTQPRTSLIPPLSIVKPSTFTAPWPWSALADCESDGHWWLHGSHEGGLQFAPSTWRAYRLAGYPAHAYDATIRQQIAVAVRVEAAQGWKAWPVCSRVIGVRADEYRP